MTTQVASIAACLPEQFINTGSRWPPARTTASRESSSSGKSGGVCSSDSSRPAPARIRRTASMWNGSPEWDAHATASSSPSRSSPARSMPTAWSGLLHERGSTWRGHVARGVRRAPVGRQRHHRPVVVPLHEPRPHDLGQHGLPLHHDGRRYPPSGVEPRPVVEPVPAVEPVETLGRPASRARWSRPSRPPAVEPVETPAGGRACRDPSPVVEPVEYPVVEPVETCLLSTDPIAGPGSPQSPIETRRDRLGPGHARPHGLDLHPEMCRRLLLRREYDEPRGAPPRTPGGSRLRVHRPPTPGRTGLVPGVRESRRSLRGREADPELVACEARSTHRGQVR